MKAKMIRILIKRQSTVRKRIVKRDFYITKIVVENGLLSLSRNFYKYSALLWVTIRLSAQHIPMLAAFFLRQMQVSAIGNCIFFQYVQYIHS